jgi:hypothetical protein
MSILLIVLLCSSLKKPGGHKVDKVTHVLNPFNGMHSGFKPNGIPEIYSAQVTTIKSIVDFTPQNNASKPAYKFGYIQMLYDQTVNNNIIQVVFNLPPNENFNIELSVETNVENSTFNFTVDGTTQTKTANKGISTIPVTFKGNTTGQYLLLINPEYKMDFTTFLLTEIKITTTYK